MKYTNRMIRILVLLVAVLLIKSIQLHRNRHGVDKQVMVTVQLPNLFWF